MKKILFLLFVCAVSVSAQDKITLAVDSTYTSNDTTAWITVSPYVDYNLTVGAGCDTANFGIYIDFRGDGMTSSQYDSYTVSDSTNYKGAAAGRLMYKSYDLTDHIIGAAYVRLRVVKRSTGGNTAGGAETYRAYLLRRIY